MDKPETELQKIEQKLEKDKKEDYGAMFGMGDDGRAPVVAAPDAERPRQPAGEENVADPEDVEVDLPEPP